MRERKKEREREADIKVWYSNIPCTKYTRSENIARQQGRRTTNISSDERAARPRVKMDDSISNLISGRIYSIP